MKHTQQYGSAIIDAMIAIALFAVVFVGFFALMQAGVKAVVYRKASAGALVIAQSHIEYIRSLNYDSIGIVGGNPNGVIQNQFTRTLNGIRYDVNTVISWHDDPGDGLGVADTNPNDYKSVKVTVNWQRQGGNVGEVSLSTFVADFIPE